MNYLLLNKIWGLRDAEIEDEVVNASKLVVAGPTHNFPRR